MVYNFLMVGLGGCLGSMMRYGTGLLFKANSFPFSTLVVNILGSLLIGIIIGAGIKDQFLFSKWKLFLATGLCGGFTTFSAFSAENLQLIVNGKFFISILYTGSSIILGIAAVWIGIKIVTS